MKIVASKVYSGAQIRHHQQISIANGQITGIQDAAPGAAADFENLAPALFDTHINGGEHRYFTRDADEETLNDIVLSAEKYGTGFVLPALITSSPENIMKGIQAVKDYKAKYPGSGLAGMHLEGPFLNVHKRGAHLEKYIRKPDMGFLREIIAHGRDCIRIITVAPENFTDDLLDLLLESGINVSAGHSNATLQEAQHAFDRGVRLVTHLYNAMSPFTHRAPGLIGASLGDGRVFAPIIPDGTHCDFEALRIAFKCKKEKLFLISDALFQGRKTGSFQWEEFDAFLKNDQYVNSEGNLAGATISLAEGVLIASRELDISLGEALEMATLRPAAALGMDDLLGKVAEGYPARFTVFDNNTTSLKFIKY